MFLRWLLLGIAMCSGAETLGERVEIVADGKVVFEAVMKPTGNEGITWDEVRNAPFRPWVDTALPRVEASSGQTEISGRRVQLRAEGLNVPAGTRLRLVRWPGASSAPWRIHPADHFAGYPRAGIRPVEAGGSNVLDSLMVARPIVIAHRGASGYLPEHTREAASMAYGMGADVVEQDVVLTRDDVPIVLHDIHLDTVTNVADLFPQRARPDGRWYAIDFSLAEIKSMNVHERVAWPQSHAIFPNRFPLGKGTFRVATLAEMIELVQGLNQSTARDVGLYPELKQPSWHRKEGHDLAKAMLTVLDQYGYADRSQNVYVQCFEADELRRVRQDLTSALRLIQLIGEDDEADTMWSRDGLVQIAQYADGVGPSIRRILTINSDGRVESSPIVNAAHQHGLVVHAFTVRRDDVPSGFESDTQVIQACREAGVDGLFCDFPDRALAVLGEPRR